MDNFLKISYLGKTKFTSYLGNPPKSFEDFQSEVNKYLQLRHVSGVGLLFYWIDEQGDHIDLLLQQDYIIFLQKCRGNLHIYVESPSECNDNNGDEAVHTKVECDECRVMPIVGFRYKCVQCLNFDICSKCEAKRLHPEHMMIRIPTPTNTPMFDTAHLWSASGRLGSLGKRNKRCASAAAASLSKHASDAGGCSDEAKGHHGRHHRKHGLSSTAKMFSNLHDMLQNLAESGPEGTYTADQQQATTAPSSSKDKKGVNSIVPPKTPPSTPTDIEPTLQSEAQSKKSMTSTSSNPSPQEDRNATNGSSSAQSQANSKEATTNTSPASSHPQLSSPLLENVQHFIDPQFMKTGIEILNNFSEMFAKMLDPSDGGCPLNSGVYNIDPKSSASSSDSQVNDASVAAAAGNVAATAAGIAANAATAAGIATNAATAAAAAADNAAMMASAASTSSSAVSAVQKQTDDLSDSAAGGDPENNLHRIENDWQIIDKGVESITGSASEINSISRASTTSLDSDSTPPSDKIDYAKLSKDLQAHIKGEQKIAAGLAQDVPVVSCAQPKPNATPKSQERRAVIVYHADSRINNSVQILMAMGFSNEGGSLTKLLESVNGNIPEALDIMHAAQSDS